MNKIPLAALALLLLPLHAPAQSDNNTITIQGPDGSEITVQKPEKTAPVSVGVQMPSQPSPDFQNWDQRDEDHYVSYYATPKGFTKRQDCSLKATTDDGGGLFYPVHFRVFTSEDGDMLIGWAYNSDTHEKAVMLGSHNYLESSGDRADGDLHDVRIEFNLPKVDGRRTLQPDKAFLRRDDKYKQHWSDWQSAGIRDFKCKDSVNITYVEPAPCDPALSDTYAHDAQLELSRLGYEGGRSDNHAVDIPGIPSAGMMETDYEKDLAGKNVLSLGEGTSGLAPYLAGLKRSIGVDIHITGVDYLYRNPKTGVSHQEADPVIDCFKDLYKFGDATKLTESFPRESVDVILSVAMICCIAEHSEEECGVEQINEGLRDALRESYKVLKHGGAARFTFGHAVTIEELTPILQKMRRDGFQFAVSLKCSDDANKRCLLYMKKS